jgi:hypothetical protein
LSTGGAGTSAGRTGARRAGAPRTAPTPKPKPKPSPSPGLARSLATSLVGGYDLNGPRVRLGLLWFVVLLVSVAMGDGAVGLVMALVCGAAASQSAASWRRVGRRPNQIVAGLAGLALPLAAAIGTGALGLVAIVVAGASVAMAATDRRRRSPIFADAGLTLRCGYVVGVAGASFVVIHRLESWAAVALVLLLCAYDVGDFLVGTGASTPVEGPIAGIAAVVVVTFAIGVFAFPPFDMASAWVFGGMAAALCPLGQVLATALLPVPDARAPALRRVDSLLIVGPLWACALWSYLG